MKRNVGNRHKNHEARHRAQIDDKNRKRASQMRNPSGKSSYAEKQKRRAADVITTDE